MLISCTIYFVELKKKNAYNKGNIVLESNVFLVKISLALPIVTLLQDKTNVLVVKIDKTFICQLHLQWR